MKKKAIVIVALVLLGLTASHSAGPLAPTQGAPLNVEAKCEGTIHKKPGESFTIEVSFRNKGSTENIWKTAVTFEGDHWTWKGGERLLSLKPSKKRTLVWKGTVPEDAAVDTIARLVVYVDNYFVALNWWIHVGFDAELQIVHSRVS